MSPFPLQKRDMVCLTNAASPYVSGGSVKAEGLGDGLPPSQIAIAKLRRLRLTLPPSHRNLRLGIHPGAARAGH